ncbi:MAG: MFS transporter, partial [Chloroflexi bacterium]|nr:MFS transporter [Chloroflexota bacterium]
ALRIVAGFGHALFGVSQHAYVAGAASTGSRGRALALYGGLTRIGSFIGPMAGGLVAAAYGLRPTFLFFGATNVALLSAVICFVQSPAQPSGAVQPAPPGGHLWRTLREHYRPLGIAGVGQLLAQTIRAGRAAVIPLYAADVLGLDVQTIGLILSLTAAVDMSLFYPAGWIMDHLGRKYAILPSFGIQALGMFLIPFTGSFVGLLLAAMLIGLGNGIGAGCMMTLGADLAPQHTRGEFLGLWRLIGDVGHTGGPMVVGQVADLVALPTAAWAIAAAGLCAALIFGLLVNEPNPNGAAGRRARAVQP